MTRTFTYHELSALLGFLDAMGKATIKGNYRLERTVMQTVMKRLVPKALFTRQPKYRVTFSKSEALAFGKLFLLFEDKGQLLYTQPLQFTVANELFMALDGHYDFEQVPVPV